MDYILTKTDKNIPVYNVIKHKNVPSLELCFLESQMGMTADALRSIMQSPDETGSINLFTTGNSSSNSYVNYSKLDEFNVKYGFIIQEARPAIEAQPEVTDSEGNIISPAIEAQAAIPEIKDNLITVNLLQLSDVEMELNEIKTNLSSLNIGMAEILGV